MSLTTVLHRYSERQFVARPATFPTTLQVQAAAITLADRFDVSAQPPNAEDLGHLLRRFTRAHAVGHLSQFTRREWAKATWGIWDDVYPLSTLERFWIEFQAFLHSHSRRLYVKKLILTYLRDFADEDAGICIAARLIREFIANEDHKDWIWTQRHKMLFLFDPKLAPQHVATFLLSADHPLDSALTEAGCCGVAACGGMERAAFGETLKTLFKELGTTVDHAVLLRRTLGWAERSGDLRFPALRVQLAESLLLPWRSAQPSTEVQSQVLGFLLKHYRDPRLDRQGWIGIGEPSQQIVRRWLTKASLEQFITVVTRVAKGTHWKYRKAFWMSYYERDLIDEAWVLFGREARARARQAFEDEAGFGRIDGGLSNHCVLLMRIGDLTIADWSHDGKCRIWNSDNKDAPDLYRGTYGIGALKNWADFDQSHQGSETHHWQELVAKYIRDKTGAWVPRATRVPQVR